MKSYTRKTSGFTLVEISIVMIIVGLLIGGTFGGMKLIENMQVNKTVQDLKAIESAALTFKDTYGRLPGDLRNPSTRLANFTVSYWFFSQGRHALTTQWGKEAVKDIEDQVGIITMKSVWEPELLKDIELWSGTKTILQGGVSHNGGVIQTANANLSETKRPVLQAGDVIGLGPTRQVIRVASMPHLLISDAVPYYTVSPWAEQVRDVRDLHRGLADG